jgi:hypothetical protein
MFAALMIGVHLSISAFMERAEASRRHLLGAGHFLADLGEPFLDGRIGSAPAIAALSLAMISFGVPFGAHTPCQIET